MPVYDLVIHGGTVVTPHGVFSSDVAVLGEKIAALGDLPEGKNNVDASGKFVLPGVIDSHVHLALDTGETVSSDDFYSGTVAAACGGVTSVMDFSAGSRERAIPDDIRIRLETAAPSVVDYSLHGEVIGWHPGREEEISAAMELGVGSFKFFMAYGKSGKRTALGEMLQAFGTLAAKGAVALVHAEEENIIEACSSRLSPEEKGSMGSVAAARPDLCEAAAVNEAGWAAAVTGVRCHVVHLSSARGLEEVRQARRRGAAMTAETCPQYLLLSSDVYGRPEGHLFSAAPALRSREDNEVLWKGLASGNLDFAASDHCPFTRAQKKWRGTFEGLPGGLPGVETLLPILYSEGVLRGRLTLCDLARITSENTARLFGLYPRKGCLLPGSDADMVLLDPEEAWTVRAGTLRTNADFSPYEGLQLKGKVSSTLSRGELVYSEGCFLGKKGRGKFLPRRRAERFGSLSSTGAHSVGGLFLGTAP